MKGLHILTILIIAVLVSVLSACSHDQDKDGVPDDKDKCPDTSTGAKVDKNGCPAERKLGNIHFYIETSASMGGYMKGATEFIQVLPNLLVDIENRITTKSGKIQTYFIAEGLTPFTGSVNDFIASFSTQNVANEKSSPMDNTFGRITGRLDTLDIAIFVSDCIISGTNEQIKNSPDRDFNKDRAGGLLSANLRDAFSKIRRKGYAANVYGFYSNFNGTYFSYRNDKIALKGEALRPYYVWIIGNSELVNRFTDTLKTFKTFRPELEIEFGKNDKVLTNYSIIYNKFKSGKWRARSGEIDDIKLMNGSATFAIAVDLASLPHFAQDTAYLKRSIRISGGEADINVLRVSNQEKISSKDVLDKKTYESPHMIVFELKQLVKDSEVQISLPYDFTTAYESWSTMDDLDKSKLNKTTFGFKYLVEAVKGAYDDSNKDFFKYSITLKK